MEPNGNNQLGGPAPGPLPPPEFRQAANPNSDRPAGHFLLGCLGMALVLVAVAFLALFVTLRSNSGDTLVTPLLLFSLPLLLILTLLACRKKWMALGALAALLFTLLAAGSCLLQMVFQ